MDTSRSIADFVTAATGLSYVPGSWTLLEHGEIAIQESTRRRLDNQLRTNPHWQHRYDIASYILQGKAHTEALTKTFASFLPNPSVLLLPIQVIQLVATLLKVTDVQKTIVAKQAEHQQQTLIGQIQGFWPHFESIYPEAAQEIRGCADGVSLICEVMFWGWTIPWRLAPETFKETVKETVLTTAKKWYWGLGSEYGQLVKLYQILGGIFSRNPEVIRDALISFPENWTCVKKAGQQMISRVIECASKVSCSSLQGLQDLTFRLLCFRAGEYVRGLQQIIKSIHYWTASSATLLLSEVKLLTPLLPPREEKSPLKSEQSYPVVERVTALVSSLSSSQLAQRLFGSGTSTPSSMQNSALF